MFCIRKMRNEDIADVAMLEQKIFPDPWSEKSIYETWKQKQTLLLAAFDNKEIIGYVILYFVLEDGEIARIAVDDEHRRQGVATKMLRELAILSREMGISKLMLDVRESNVPAREFYEKHGFEIDGVRKNYYSDPKEDAILMSLFFGK